MSIRLAGVTDLRASGGKYHNQCRTMFERETSKSPNETPVDGIADDGMELICDELCHAATKGQVVALTEVWDRYCVLMCENGRCIPDQLNRRMSAFKYKLQDIVGDAYHFVQTPKTSNVDGETILVPVKYENIALSNGVEQQLSGDEDELTMPSYSAHDDIFLSMVHVALKLRGDLLHHEGHTTLSVSADAAVRCIPDSVYMFLQLLYGGEQKLGDDANSNEKHEQKVLSMGQDMLYGINNGSKLTPKHIGLGCTLHQATRSKKLVELFHNAGHVISYCQVLQVDTSLAECTLRSMDQDSGAVLPTNISAGKFAHFTADNIDINDGTLDGKNTFHATQMAIWQRKKSSNCILDSLNPTKSKTLNVPDIMNVLEPVRMSSPRQQPVFTHCTKESFETLDIPSSLRARSVDNSFLIRHYNQDITQRSTWTAFNKAQSTNTQEITEVGYMPIIQAPAHEYDTLNTVVRRCMYVSSKLGQEYTVITTDQALYCKLMELKWENPEYKTVIPRLGGLHTAMAFLSTIGQHIENSGLTDAWTESGLLGPLAAEKVVCGKSYAKSMRAHKLSLQALWRELMQQRLHKYLGCHDDQLLQMPTNDIER